MPPSPASSAGAGAAEAAANGSVAELFLIDGNSLAYRAFFALPESIATADGRPTNAIYGFASMMAKILIDHRPSSVIVAWDAGMSGRDETYSAYKAHRPGRPDLLREQWPHLAPLADAFGFLNVKVSGYEADDVIATLTKRARDAGHRVMIVSGDRDVYQLVGDGVRVMTTSRGVTDTKVYDRDGVIERYGVTPEQVPDLIGLRGDTSDNIPGVPGIGDKTAAQLLQRFGTVEGVLDSIDEISGAKRKQNLTEHADDARVSKALATAVYDVEVPLGALDELRSEPDLSRLREAAAEFELRQVIRRLEEEYHQAVPGRSVDETIEFEATRGTIDELAEGSVSLALAGGEWAATDGARVVTGELSDPLELVAQALSRPLIAHDAKDLGGTGRFGLLNAAAPAGGLDLAHDTMVAAYLIDPARRTYDLHELAADAGLAAAEIARVAA
ncbi:MAG: DNA polymerase I, partial [Solirubrobacterales bacterium]|nr:DNA polymerase I [Solirubrobacterales bacterium]